MRSRRATILVISGIFLAVVHFAVVSSGVAMASSKISPEIGFHESLKQERLEAARLEGERETLDPLRPSRSTRFGFVAGEPEIERCAIYVTRRLDDSEIDEFAARGIEVSSWAWVPPVAGRREIGRHEYGFHLARIPYARLHELDSDARIVRVVSTERLAFASNHRTGERIRSHDVHLAQGIPRRTGAGVLIGIIDVDLDVEHPDLPEPIETFDITTGDSPASWSTEVDSPHSTGHGTHVSGIALGRGVASNGRLRGVAPSADLAFYKVYSDEHGDVSTDALIRAVIRATEAGCDVLNVSLGVISTFLDGGGPLCQSVDAGSSRGMVTCAAAGNLAAEGIHAFVEIEPGGTVEIEIERVLSFNRPFEALLQLVWRDGPSQRAIGVEPADPDQPLEVEPVFRDTGPRGTRAASFVVRETETDPKRRIYRVRLRSVDRRGPARVHVYLHRSEPARLLPSTSDFTMTAPAIADTVIGVGNWEIASEDDEFDDRVHFASSAGPRLDGLPKPEVLAPGTSIVSCAGISEEAEEELYSVKTGTSMSSPAVAGAVALLLEAEPHLAPYEVSTLLRLGADRVGAADSRHGYGVIDCVESLLLLARGVPTGCDPNAAVFQDCDGDRLPDHCQIAAIAALDGNENGMLDDCEVFFHRGDGNDDGNLDISDSLYIIRYLFIGGDAPDCLETGDANDDGKIDLSDAVSILVSLFLGFDYELPFPGPPPHPCNANTTSESFLGCETYGSC